MELKQVVNESFESLFTQRPHYAILMGGRGAGRSTVASQFANAKLVGDEYFRCAIMRLVLGDIRNSIYREITDRAEENGILDSLGINDSLMVLKYGANTINAVGFKKSSGQQKAKLKSLANYNCVIIEEADEIEEADFMQLDDSLRTLKGDILIILLLNPPAKDHWIIKRWFDLESSEIKDFYIPKLKEGMDDTLFIHTNWEANKDNISPDVATRYENYRTTKPAHYWNMVKGYVPETVKGKIYSGWQQIDDIPFEARLERYGLDFGYTNDPTAIVAIYYYNGGYILDEVAFQPELTNKDIAGIFSSQPKSVIIADSAEPKSIDEIRRVGQVTILPASKGAGSVNQGIQYVQQQKISVTRHSENIWNEYNNYAWLVDKEDVTLNEPKPGYDHSMDAIRYAVTSIKDPNQKGAAVYYPQSNSPRNNLNPSTPTIGAPVDLWGKDDKPKTAHIHIPRL